MISSKCNTLTFNLTEITIEGRPWHRGLQTDGEYSKDSKKQTEQRNTTLSETEKRNKEKTQNMSDKIFLPCHEI